jgi:hypothetical protein
VSGLLGGAPGPFFGMTVVLFGFAAILTGQAIAESWRPAWQIVPAALLLAAADRFLLYALFDAVLLSPGGVAVAAMLLAAITAASYYNARARKMVQQYPWLYEHSGPFGWRAKSDFRSGRR